MRLRNLVYLLGAIIALVACGKSENKAEAASASVTSAAPAASSSDAGVARYPGMETLTSMRHAAAPGVDMVNSNYKSSDKPEKILAFYRDQFKKTFGDGVNIQEMSVGEGMTQLQTGTGSSLSISVLVRAEGADSIVQIQTYDKTN